MGLKTLATVSLGILSLIIIINNQVSAASHTQAQAQAQAKAPDPGRVDNFLSILKHASNQGFSYTRDLVTTVPISKMLLVGGALLSLFFMFLRLLIVIGPILVLGSLTRESTDAGDMIKLLIEFYNQVVTALDENMKNAPQV